MNDPQKRQSYDRHGIWPPPTEELPRHSDTQDNTRDRPFYPNIFTFTDPFELFNSFFGHPSPFHDPSPFGPPRAFPDPFFAPPSFPFSPGPFGPFGPFNPGVGMGGGPLHDMFPHDTFMMHPQVMGGDFFQSQCIGNGGPASYFSSGSSFSNHQRTGGGQWISESRSTSIINGLKTSVHERIDSSVRALSPQ